MPSPPDRRQFMGTMSLAGLGSLAARPASAHTSPASQQPQGTAGEARTGVTRALARYVVQARYADVPPAVRKEAQRTLLNWMGCAVGGSRHETLDAAISALAPFSGPPQASVLGRRERMDVLHASLMNGISSHVFDFDDTHLKPSSIRPGPWCRACWR